MLASKEFEWEKRYKRAEDGKSKRPSLCPIYSKPADQKKDVKVGRPPPFVSRGRKVLGERTNLCNRTQHGDNSDGGAGDIGHKGGNEGKAGGGMGRAWLLRKMNFFKALKNLPKNVATKLEGGGRP